MKALHVAGRWTPAFAGVTGGGKTARAQSIVIAVTGGAVASGRRCCPVLSRCGPVIAVTGGAVAPGRRCCLVSSRCRPVVAVTAGAVAPGRQTPVIPAQAGIHRPARALIFTRAAIRESLCHS
jgi:hypothetical protein